MKRKDLILIRVPTVHTVNQILQKLDKAFLGPKAAAKSRPLTTVSVLRDIEPTNCKLGPKRVKTSFLLVHFMPTIINNHVKGPVFYRTTPQKYTISLIANLNLHPRSFNYFAARSCFPEMSAVSQPPKKTFHISIEPLCQTPISRGLMSLSFHGAISR